MITITDSFFQFQQQDTYNMFGDTLHADDAIIRPLESQGLKRLYPQNYDAKRELKKLNHSILVSFLDLIDIVIRAPDSDLRREKIDNLTLLFIHMHHLINEFRPHQARETLRVMMMEQKRQRLEIAERFQRHLDKVQTLLNACVEQLPDATKMESKLTIKMLPSASQDSKSGPSDFGNSTFKSEPLTPQPDEDMDTVDEHQQQLNTLDQMMCDIVDAM